MGKSGITKAKHLLGSDISQSFLEAQVFPGADFVIRSCLGSQWSQETFLLFSNNFSSHSWDFGGNT